MRNLRILLALLAATLWATSLLAATQDGLALQSTNQLGGQGASPVGAMLDPGMQDQGSVRGTSARVQSPTIRSTVPLGTVQAGEGQTPDQRYLSLVPKQKPAPTDFQNLVENATGQQLPIFGQDMFDLGASFSPPEAAAVSSDYVIGPADEVVIRAWGQVDIDYRAVVDRNGTINIPKVGVINLTGVRYDQVQGLVKSAVGRIFNNFDLTVTLGQLHSLQVFVVGQVAKPGAYTLSPMSTLVNAVYAAGGPNMSGSLRRIQLKRGAKLVSEFDFYDLLLKGDKSRDVRLQPGDVINVMPVGYQVAISGSVNAPAIFEAKEGESVGDLVAWAGGFSALAQTGSISLQRNGRDSGRRIETVKLDAMGMGVLIRGGDIATVSAISPQLKNSLTIRGNIDEPKHFAWYKGVRVSDLIPDREALITKDYWLGKNKSMFNKADTIKPLPDSLRVDDQFTDQDKRKRVAVDLKRSLSEINWDYAVVERLNRQTLTTDLLPFNLERAIGGEDESNLALEPGDVITIFSKDDINVPLQMRSVYVRVEGEVKHGGIFKLAQGENLRQLLARVGGLTPNAYLYALSLQRESLRLDQQQKMDMAIAKAESQLGLGAATSAASVTTPEDAATQKTKFEAQKDALDKLRKIKATGRLVLSTSEDTSIDNLPDTVLQDGDVVTVPSVPTTVEVLGEVTSPNAFIYRSGSRLKDYLAMAGGVSQFGDRGNVYVVHMNGVAQAKGGLGLFTLSSFEGLPAMPGDTLIVPQNYDKTTLMKDIKDVTQIFYQFGLGAAAIRVLTK